MVQKHRGVLSPTGDALLLAALFIPFAPIVTTFDLYLVSLVLGCPADTAQACFLTGFDINHLFTRSTHMLAWTAKASHAGAVLLVYMAVLAGLAQFTTRGFRGRVVRTCAVIMWASVLPLVLTLAQTITRSSEQMCGNGPCDTATLLTSFVFVGNVFFQWLTNIAVPLAVLVSGLLALTLGYRILIGKFVNLVFQRD